MKRLRVVLLFCCTVLMGWNAYTQDCYADFLSQGIEAFNQLEFEDAVNSFKAARICPNITADQISTANNWVDRANTGIIDAIEQARDAAMQSEEQAKQAQARAEKQALISEANRLAYLANQELTNGNLDEALPLAFLGLEMTEGEPLPFVREVFGNVIAHGSIEMKGSEVGILETNFLNDKSIWSRSKDGLVDVWNTEGKLLAILSGDKEKIVTVQSLDEKRLISCSENGKVDLWEGLLGDGDLAPYKTQIGDHNDVIYDLEYSGNGESLITSSRDGSVKFWDIGENKLIREMAFENVPVLEAKVFSGGTRVVMRTADKKLKVYSSAGDDIAEIQAEKHIYSISISPDDESILATSADGLARVWDREGNPVLTISDDGKIKRAHFLADGNVVTTSGDNQVKIWDKSGRESKSFSHPGSINGIAISDDFEKYLTFADDQVLRIWDANGALVTVLDQFQDQILSATFSPNTDMVLTSTADNVVKLWDSYGNLLMNIDSHQDHIYAATFSSDGSRILSCAADGRILLTRNPGFVYDEFKRNPPQISEQLRNKFGLR